MALEIQNIRSIGWLYGARNTIRLCSIFEGSSMPKIVTITRKEFATVRGDDEKMKQMAIERLNAQ